MSRCFGQKCKKTFITFAVLTHIWCSRRRIYFQFHMRPFKKKSHSSIRFETAEKCSCTSRPSSRNGAVSNGNNGKLSNRRISWEEKKQKNGDSRTTASAFVVTEIELPELRTSAATPLEMTYRRRRNTLFCHMRNIFNRVLVAFRK